MSEFIEEVTQGSTKSRSPARASSWYRFLPLILLGSSLLGWSWMVRLAVDDPGFATEPDYYEKAVDFDRRRALEVESERRGWSVRAVEARIEGETTENRRGQVAFELVDREGRPVEGLMLQAEAFANARASRVQHVEVSSRSGGRYTIELDAPRSGLWEVRLSSSEPERLWAHTVDVEFGGDVEARR